MRIETARLRLRPFHDDDLDAYQEAIYGDADVTRYLPGGRPRPLEKTREVLEYFKRHDAEHGFSVWAVESRESGRFVGHCGLVYLHNGEEVEIAYAFGKPYWGQGYATESARASLRFGFQNAHLPYLLAMADPANTPSQQVMEKLGMRRIGPTDAYYNAQLILYRMDREDYQPGDEPFAVHL